MGLNEYDYGGDWTKLHEYLGSHALELLGVEDISENRKERKAFKWRLLASSNESLSRRLEGGSAVEISSVFQEDDPRYQNRYYYRKLRNVIGALAHVEPSDPDFDFEAYLEELENGAHVGTYVQCDVFTRPRKDQTGKVIPGETVTEISFSPAPRG